MPDPLLTQRTSHTFRDGSTVEGEARFVYQAIAIEADYRVAEKAWIRRLREQGVKAAHPDDGWVDRDKDRVILTYPQFNDGLHVGDRLALGWQDRYRIVRVTKVEEGGPIVRPILPGPYYWYFTPDD